MHPATSSASCATRPERFALTGPSIELDPRTHAFRRDIADTMLAGRLFAPHYARAERRDVIAAYAMVRAAPSDTAVAVSQLVHGEAFHLLDRVSGWAWGRCGHDDYVGYVQDRQLGAPEDALYRVSVPLALRFAAPDIKSPMLGTLPIGALVAGEPEGGFVATGDGCLHRRHVMPLTEAADDPVAVAESLIGQPYLWGGRGGGGIDCSGLVQVAFGLAGVLLPRDSDQQRAAVGVEQPTDAALERGDLIFFPGHVGIMVDEIRMIHANAHWMRVTIEPLGDVVARLAPTHPDPILAVRRIAR